MKEGELHAILTALFDDDEVAIEGTIKALDDYVIVGGQENENS